MGYSFPHRPSSTGRKAICPVNPPLNSFMSFCNSQNVKVITALPSKKEDLGHCFCEITIKTLLDLEIDVICGFYCSSFLFPHIMFLLTSKCEGQVTFPFRLRLHPLFTMYCFFFSFRLFSGLKILETHVLISYSLNLKLC